MDSNDLFSINTHLRDIKQAIEGEKISIISFWWPFWTAGFLFTAGYLGVDPVAKVFSRWDQIMYFIGYFLMWPFILGGGLK